MTNPILYNLGCGGWGTYSDWLFTNPNNPSPSQFNSDVRALMKKYGNEYLQQVDDWVSSDDWVAYIVGKLSELGYEQPATANVYIPTKGIIEYSDDNFKRIVGDDLFNLAVEHNKQIEVGL